MIYKLINKIPLLNVLLNRLFNNLMDVEWLFYKLDVEMNKI